MRLTRRPHKCAGLDAVEISPNGGDNRVKHMDVDLRWPGLADSRKVIVQRLAEACPIHGTLVSGTEITSRVRTGP